MNDDALLGEVAAAVGLREGVAGVRDVVRATARFEPVAVRKLSRAAALPVPIVSAICNELRKREVVARERPVRLTALGRALFGAGARAEKPELGPAIRRLATAVARAPQPRFDLDQAHCDLDTKVKRVLALHEADALVGRTVLLLGDDDLVSVALARLGEPLGARPERVVVLDVHGRCSRSFATSSGAHRSTSTCDGTTCASLCPSRCEARRHRLHRPAVHGRGCRALPLSCRAGIGRRSTGRRLLRVRLTRARRGAARPAFDRCDGLRHEAPGAELQRVRRRRHARRRQHLYHLTSTRETKPLVTDRYEGPLYTADRR